MKNIISLTILIFLAMSLYSKELDTLFILQTSDIHGRIYNYNYFKDKPADVGLAKVYSLVKQYRDKYKNVILLDAGDVLQGTPLTFYYNKIKTDTINPIILTMNFMEYDAFAVGNHEIEQGVKTYSKAENESNFPWLSANSTLKDGSTYFKPYTIIVRDSIKIGVIGLTTPGIPTMLDTTYYPGITWAGMVETAQKYVNILRPKVDILVGLFHAGFDAEEDSYKTKNLGLPIANASGLVAKEVPGFDLIFGGHSHKVVSKKVKSQENCICLEINPGEWGKNIGIAKFVLASRNNKYKIIDKSGWVESLKNIPASKEILELTKIFHDNILAYIRKDIISIKDTLSGKYARYKDTPMVEMINRVQRKYTDADISFAACFNEDFFVEPGKFTIKDIYTMYPYENYLYKIIMNGAQIKNYLEHSARYFVSDGNKIIPNEKIPGYHYDMAEGIRYDIDLSEEIGNRIKNIVFIKTNQPINMDKDYTVAINSYRANGGGGHMKAANVDDSSIIFKSGKEIRNILIDYITELDSITTKVDNNWKIINF